jgi:hypothetical protein
VDARTILPYASTKTTLAPTHLVDAGAKNINAINLTLKF